jgi:hypothetical protein
MSKLPVMEPMKRRGDGHGEQGEKRSRAINLRKQRGPERSRGEGYRSDDDDGGGRSAPRGINR